MPPLDGKTMQIKIYVVLQKNNVAKMGEPNENIIATKLTRAAAQSLVDDNPGTRIEKHLATK